MLKLDTIIVQVLVAVHLFLICANEHAYTAWVHSLVIICCLLGWFWLKRILSVILGLGRAAGTQEFVRTLRFTFVLLNLLVDRLLLDLVVQKSQIVGLRASVA